jgi:prepilin-type processing-associated H-X9-DG protein
LAFPAFQGAIASSKKTKCLSNLNQIGIAIMAYSADNSGYTPASTSSSGQWCRLIYPYIDSSRKVTATQLVLNRIFTCPAESLQPSDPTASCWQYCRSDALENPAVANDTRPFISIQNPSSTIMIADGCLTDTTIRSCNSSVSWSAIKSDLAKSTASSVVNVSFRHKSAMNVLYADGHSSTILWKDRASIVQGNWDGNSY